MDWLTYQYFFVKKTDFFLNFKKQGIACLRHVVATPLQDPTYSIYFNKSGI